MAVGFRLDRIFITANNQHICLIRGIMNFTARESRRFPTQQELHLAELVYLLSAGNELEYGMNFKEVRDWLIYPKPSYDGRNALQMLDSDEAEAFMAAVRTASGQEP